MNFQEILYFVTVAQEHSFSQAARLLYVTQPAVSRQIAELERELDCQLFYRERRKISLTPIGESCLPVAQRIVSDFQQLYRLTEAQKKSRTLIRIGYPNMSALDFLTTKLKVLREKYPAVNVDLLHAPATEETLQELKNYSLDAVITSQSFIQNEPELKSSLISPGRLAAVFSPDCPLSEKEPLCFQDLSAYTILIHKLGLRSCALQTLLSDCLQYGLTEEQMQMREKTEEIFMSAAMGQVIGLMPECFLDGRIGKLKAVPISDCPSHYGAVIVLRKNEANPALNLLLEC